MVLEIDEKVHGKDHPDVARELMNLGSMYFDKGEHSRAKPLLERAVAIRIIKLGVDHPQTKAAQGWLNKIK